MRRLSFLALGLLLCWLGVRLVADATTFAPYLLTDALLLGGVGGLIFALHADGWQAAPVFRRRRGLPRVGWSLLLTGFVAAVAGGFGLALGLGGIGELTARLTWGLGILLQLIGAWWPGVGNEYARPTLRWGRDAAGNIVSLPADRTDRANSHDNDALHQRAAPRLTTRAWLVWLLILLALAALLRFWNLEQLPPGCVDRECATALHLLEPENAQPTAQPSSTQTTNLLDDGLALDEWLAAFLARLTGSGLLGLRLASAWWGWLTVLFLAPALRRLVNPVAALLGTALPALSPWHLWAGRTSDPWLLSACLSALALWLGLEALARSHIRWWLPWGLAAGLLAVQTPALWPGVALWTLLVVGIGLAQARRQAGRVGAADAWRWPLCALAAAVGMALPIYPAAAALLQTWRASVPDVASNIAALFAALLRPEVTAAGSLMQSGLLSALVAALALAGAAALLRYLRRPAALLVLTGSIALLGSAALVDASALPPGTLLLPALPLLLALAAVALDRLLFALTAAWGPPLVRASLLPASIALIILLSAGRGAMTLLQGLDSAQSGAQVETDMARYMAAQLRENQEQAVTFVAPRSALEHPSLRLSAGTALTQERILPLELGNTLPFTRIPAGDVVYLLSLTDTQLLQLLRELYPGGEATSELDAAGEQALFNRYRVREADLLSAQSLPMTVAPADSPDVGVMEPVTALDFDWATAPPHHPPFIAQWSGSLIVPQSGDYTLAVEGGGPESSLTLTVDDILLLDTSLNLRQQQMPFARGIHRLHLTYRSGSEPGDLRITWQPPGEEAQTLAAPFLHSPMLPDQGLLGDYYGNERFEGPVVAAHKDPILGLDPGLSLPYSVHWHGLLAAARAGEYLIGVDAPGAARVSINGSILADNRLFSASLPDQEAEETSTYNDGLIYLPAGWHRIEVFYTAEEPTGADNAPDRIRLLWQPSGSDPRELDSHYLLPAYGLVSTVDAPLPPAPPLVDARLGDDRFALSRPTTTWQPLYRLPASGLPALALEQIWQAGGVCGDAPDQLNAPHGAVWSADGSRLYVADTGNRRVQVYDAAGSLVETITGDQWQEPVDVAAGLDGSLLVLDAAAQQIFRVDKGGNVTALPLQTSFYHPRGLAVDAASGNLIVADTGGARVVILGADGTLISEYGGQGSLLGRGQPVDVLPANDALWAISAEDGRLWNLMVDGSLTAVNPTGTVDGPQLAQVSDGRLLATDPARSTFLLFSPQGEPLAQFGYGGEVQLPTGIAAAPSAEGDIIAVVDTRACAVSAWRLGE